MYGANPLKAARALAMKIVPGCDEHSTEWVGCKNWAAGAFGYNNAKVVAWLKAATAYCPQQVKIVAQLETVSKKLSKTLAETTWELAQEKSLRSGAASKLQAQEQNQKAVIKELKKAFSADKKQLLKEKEQALKEKEQVKEKYEKMEGTAQEWEV